MKKKMLIAFFITAGLGISLLWPGSGDCKTLKGIRPSAQRKKQQIVNEIRVNLQKIKKTIKTLGVLSRERIPRGISSRDKGTWQSHVSRLKEKRAGLLTFSRKLKNFGRTVSTDNYMHLLNAYSVLKKETINLQGRALTEIRKFRAVSSVIKARES